MRTLFPLRLARHFLAIVFALCATTFSVLWIYQTQYSTPQPGFTSYDYSPATHAMTVGVVVPGSPADRAGLHPGDRIVSVDGQALNDLRPYYEAMFTGRKQAIELTVESPGPVAEQRVVKLAVSSGKRVPPRTLRWEDLLGLPLDYFPVGFLVVGITVLLLRPDDRNAWLLALLFGGFISVAPMFEANIPAALRGLFVFYKITMSWSSMALFYYFFAVFPASSPVDRKVPWLKHALLGGALFSNVPIAFRCLLAGGTLPLYLGMHWPGARAMSWFLNTQAGLPAPASHGWPSSGFLFFAFFLGTMALGLASLVSNNFLSSDAQVRRKAHVMLWGAAIGVTPICLISSIAFVGGFVNLPMAWWQLSVVFLSFVWPLSFAYAVVKHRVLEIPVLLQRSARYLLAQRGFTILLLVLWLGAVRLFTLAVSGLLGTFSNAVLVLGVVFGIGLVWFSAPAVKRATDQIDRAFFRSAYDARQILESLVEEARTVTSREELAVLLSGEIRQALHPAFASVYLEDREGKLRLYPDVSRTNQTLPSGLPLFQELQRRKGPWQLSDADPREGALPGDLGIFSPNHPECLVPILKRNGALTGLLALGAKLSEESYSREDTRLLNAVATQAGATLENMRLAEDMAERIEAERRIARDMEIAKEVQARLFPQKLPVLQTLEYAGRCIQARDVGGDYYDFLNLGAGRMGIVLADIAGKGIPGALLMANLQADVRSQSAIASQDLPQFLKSVNRSFFESTDEGRYATLFFGDYQDSTRHLRFGNCGHNPPLLVHPDGTAERLTATATVLGLLEEWESSLGDVCIVSGDVLVIYTDGITEASNSNDEEFGERRLLDTIRRQLTAPVSCLLDAILQAALEFSGGEGKMRDDLTLVVARGR